MARSLNKVMLIGNVAAEPVIANLNSGGKVANLRLITNESWKDQNGDRQERATGHDIVVYNERLVDVIEQYVQKGDLLYIEGSINVRKWQDRDGQDRWSTEIVLQKYRGEMQMLSSRADRQADEDYGSSRGRDDNRGGGGRGRDDDRGGRQDARGGGNSGGRGRDDNRSGGGGRGDDRGSGGQRRPAPAFDSDLDDDVPF